MRGTFCLVDHVGNASGKRFLAVGLLRDGRPYRPLADRALLVCVVGTRIRSAFPVAGLAHAERDDSALFSCGTHTDWSMPLWAALFHHRRIMGYGQNPRSLLRSNLVKFAPAVSNATRRSRRP